MLKNAVLMMLGLTGCATQHAATPALSVMHFEAAAAPAALERNHFTRDTGAVGEAELREILSAPVFLEEHARVGVMPVAAAYQADGAVPVEAAPAVLVDALEASGLFELASEVSAEWPAEPGLAGLRELAARYRAEYLVLFRHRFNDVTSTNPWAVGWLTLVGALVFPGQTIESAGVLEATLYDVKTGTILVTVNERVRGADIASAPALDRTTEALHQRLVGQAAPRLADQLIARCRRLVAARPGVSAPVGALR